MDNENWREFFKKVYSLFSSYDIQKDPTLYNVRNWEDWGKKNKTRGSYVWENNMPEFLSVLQKYFDVSKVNTTEFSQSSFATEELNNILRHTFYNGNRSSCQNGTTIILEGNFIKLSDISLDVCKYWTNQESEIKTLKIFSTDTIFIDSDFTSIGNSSDFTMVVCAPKWEIIGTRTINLDGKPFEESRTKAEMGENGKPGFPGKTGGTFLGIAQKISGGNLTISACGGRGDRGQDGGDGLPGRDGIAATTAFFDYMDHEKIGGTRWRIYGETGKQGGKGGDGGRGGSGGNPGQVKIFNLGGGGVNVTTSKGEDGENGRGGEGGAPGQSGKNLEATYVICCWSGEEEMENGRKGLPGDVGVDGGNEEGRITPGNSEENFREKIIEYKTRLRSYFSKLDYRKEEIKDFLTQIDLSSDFFNYLQLEGVIEDYQKIEEQFIDYDYYSQKIELFLFYENLEKLIQKEFRNFELSKEEKIVLFHLYTAVLTKLDINDKDMIETSLVVKIENYLNNKIDHYRRLQRYGADDIFNDYYYIRRNSIDSLIEDTQEFIEKYILKEEESSQESSRVVKKFAKILDQFGDLGTNLTKITSESNHISNFLLLRNGTEVKVPKNEISSIRKVLAEIRTDQVEDIENEEIKVFGETIENSITKLKLEILKDVEKFEKELKSKKLSSLDLTKWKIPDVLKRWKYFLKKFPKNETVRVLEGLNHMIDIYRRIDNFYRVSRMVPYIKEVDSGDWASHLSGNFSNFSKLVEKLKLDSVANLVISQYEKNVDVIKQYAFPYGSELFKKFKLKSSVISRSRNLTALLYECIDYTGNLQSNLFRYINPWSSELMIESGYNDRYPYFVWKNSQHKLLLKKLFSGKEIVFNVDLPKSDYSEAAHFKRIDLNFKAINATDQEMIDSNLAYFSLKLIHWGNSYYKCDNKTYLITTSSLPMEFSFQKNHNNDDRGMRNGVFSKITEGDEILSPYTFWTLQLQESEFRKVKTFRDLAGFEELVDVHLIGGGTYMSRSEGRSNCPSDIEKFYEVDDPLPKPEDLERRRKRDVGNDCFTSCTSGASSASSPFDSVFKWVSSSGDSISRIVYLGSFATKLVEGEALPVTNSVVFFDQINSFLILAPILIFLGKSWFFQTREERKKPKIQDSRVQVWKEIIKMFKLIILKYHLDVNWLRINLEEREEEVSSGGVMNEDLEMSLVTLLVDFLEGVQHDEALARVKNDRNFIRDVDGLIEISQRIPDFWQKLNSM